MLNKQKITKMILVGKLIALPLIGFCQENLIINGDCEDYKHCPIDNSNIEEVTGFFNFSYTGSPDYLNVCSEIENVTIPSPRGFQLPRSGNGMIHDIIAKGTPPGYVSVDSLYPYTYRTESFGGSFIKKLEPGIYEFSMYVNFADYGKAPPEGLDARVATNAFDLILLEDSIKVWRPTSPFIDQFEVIPLNGEAIINDTINWIELKTCFLAKGGERFFTIGSFRDTSTIKLEFSGFSTNRAKLGLYYFDDFSLRACPTCCAGQFEIEEYVTVNYTENGVQLVPFVLAGSTGSLRLYDSAGRWVASHTFESDSPPFVLPNLAQGMYHYFFETQSGTQKMGKVMSF